MTRRAGLWLAACQTVDDRADPVAQFEVTVGAAPQPGLDFFAFLPSTLGENLLNLGTTLFYRYDVSFNQAQGQIGFLAH